LEAQKLDVPKDASGSNVLDAITMGATDGFRLAVNVGIMLLVFTALIAMINFVLTEWIGSWTGLNDFVVASTDGRFSGFNFEFILGKIFSPIAWLLGVSWEDSDLIGQLLGMKTAINEFYAYAQLPGIKGLLQEKSLIIVTYALCGFANFASIGIQIGGISAIAPGQRKNLTSLALKAMIGGTIAAFLTAIIAGVLV
jgi:CNT family concentrative nucleoside transporter